MPRTAVVPRTVRKRRDALPMKRNTLYHGTDPEALSELWTRSNLPVKVEALNTRGVSFHYEFASAGPISFGRGSYEGDSLWSPQAGSRIEKLLIHLPSIGDAFITTGQGELHSRPGWATIVEGRRTEGARIHGPRRSVSMYIEESKLVGRLASLLERPVCGSLDIHPNIDLTTGAGQVLKHLVEAASCGIMGSAPLRQSPLALTNLCEALTCLLLESIPHRFSAELLRPAALPAPWHVKRAIDFMRAHLADPISVEDIALAATVSERSLQEGFRRFKMTTPMAYLRTLRLAAARLDLLNDDLQPTIAAVALKWGFSHLGRFSAVYRAAYGEHPSETVRRRAAMTGHRLPFLG